MRPHLERWPGAQKPLGLPPTHWGQACSALWWPCCPCMAGGQPVPVRGLYSSPSDTSWPLNIDGVLLSLTDARGDFTAAQRDRGKGLALPRMPSQGWPTEAGRGAGAKRAALRCWRDMGLDSQLRAPPELSCEPPAGASPTEAGSPGFAGSCRR